MSWMESGAEDHILLKWGKEMWWAAWTRQHHVNFVGMWKRRLEEEDKEMENGKLKHEEMVKIAKEKDEWRTKVMRRLRQVNEGMGVIDEGLGMI
jgi:hypothetical protein